MKVKTLVLRAALVALTMVATMMIQVPTPATKGYVNLGDSMVFISALLFGPITGAIAGGLGSALADLFTGYALWAPMTLVIKGIEGFMVGALFRLTRRSLTEGWGIGLALPVVLLGGLWMVFGYFVCEIFLFGLGPAAAAVPGNLFQAAVGACVALPVAAALARVTRGVGRL